MDALVKAALDKVNTEIQKPISMNNHSLRKDQISKLVNTVDALKSALKAL